MRAMQLKREHILPQRTSHKRSIAVKRKVKSLHQANTQNTRGFPLDVNWAHIIISFSALKKN